MQNNPFLNDIRKHNPDVTVEYKERSEKRKHEFADKTSIDYSKQVWKSVLKSKFQDKVACAKDMEEQLEVLDQRKFREEYEDEYRKRSVENTRIQNEIDRIKQGGRAQLMTLKERIETQSSNESSKCLASTFETLQQSQLESTKKMDVRRKKINEVINDVSELF